jgi:hypothetical protein
MNIFLIGYRGTGKSEVGRMLATMLKRPWLDMDEELTHRLGTTLQAYVGRWGWPAFRREEKGLLQEACHRNGWVVSTGGGVVLDAGNVTAMRGCGRVIWLQASPGTIQERLAADPRSMDLHCCLADRDFPSPLTKPNDLSSFATLDATSTSSGSQEPTAYDTHQGANCGCHPPGTRLSQEQIC